VTEHSEQAQIADRAAPVLVVVDGDEHARLATEKALARRFSPITASFHPLGGHRAGVTGAVSDRRCRCGSGRIDF